GQREARPRRLRTRRQRGESPRVPFNHDNGSPALLSQRARISPVAFVGPPNGGSPAPRRRLVAEDLLLYDKDGQSRLDDHALPLLPPRRRNAGEPRRLVGTARAGAFCGPAPPLQHAVGESPPA